MIRLLVPVLLLLALGCRTPQPMVYAIEERNMDTLYVRAQRNPKEATPPSWPDHPIAHKLLDITHTDLTLSFDWAQKSVNGKAHLRCTPWFYALDTITLDAVGFSQIAVFLNDKPVSNYRYDRRQLRVPLTVPLSGGDTLSLTIKYRAKPGTVVDPQGGHQHQGMHFQPATPGHPRQIWTHGQPSGNAHWFPTQENPSERFTQSVRLRVDTIWQTISNGRLVESYHHGDGTRTDHWQLDKPHAPYLATVVVGRFAPVRDDLPQLPITYWVDSAYQKEAKTLLGRTPAMVAFFSDLLDFPFPWPGYQQVVVRHFVAAAMENTGATILNDAVYKVEPERIDRSDDALVAHELMHQWFGNVVTVEDWSHIVLHEGVASYAEYLWQSHAQGQDAADFSLFQDRLLYQQYDQDRPLIPASYSTPKELFDRVTYDKGAAVLHMLRHELGDEAFFAGLGAFLRKHQYQSVEIADFRLAMEEVSGRNLFPFFQQWFRTVGYPRLEISYSYDQQLRVLRMVVTQTQTAPGVPPVFRFPLSVACHRGSNVSTYGLSIDQRTDTLAIPMPEAPDLIIADPGCVLLGEVNEEKPRAMYRRQLKQANHMIDRYRALRALRGDRPELDTADFATAVRDSFWGIRRWAIWHCPDTAQESTLMTLASKDSHAEVRKAALEALAAQRPVAGLDTLVWAIVQSDSVYRVLDVALRLLYEDQPREAVLLAEAWKDKPGQGLWPAISYIMAATENSAYLPALEKMLAVIDHEYAPEVMEHYQTLVGKADAEQIAPAGLTLASIASATWESLYRRLAATQALNQLYNDVVLSVYDATTPEALAKRRALAAQLRAWLADIQQKEQHPQLQKIYRRLPRIQMPERG